MIETDIQISPPPQRKWRFVLLDASLEADIDETSGAVRFTIPEKFLSPMNIAALLSDLKEMPDAVRRINSCGYGELL